MFFPPRGKTAPKAELICETCPELAPCRRWALSCSETLKGIWGGTSEVERRRLRSGARMAMTEGLSAHDEDDDLDAPGLEQLDEDGPEQLDDLVATTAPKCAICNEALPVERQRVGAKTCFSPDCQREHRTRRDQARKLRATTNGSGAGTAASNGKAHPVPVAVPPVAVSAPSYILDPIDDLLSDLVACCRRHPSASLSVRVEGVRISLKAVSR